MIMAFIEVQVEKKKKEEGKKNRSSFFLLKQNKKKTTLVKLFITCDRLKIRNFQNIFSLKAFCLDYYNKKLNNSIY